MSKKRAAASYVAVSDKWADQLQQTRASDVIVYYMKKTTHSDYRRHKQLENIINSKIQTSLFAATFSANSRGSQDIWPQVLPEKSQSLPFFPCQRQIRFSNPPQLTPCSAEDENLNHHVLLGFIFILYLQIHLCLQLIYRCYTESALFVFCLFHMYFSLSSETLKMHTKTEQEE